MSDNIAEQLRSIARQIEQSSEVEPRGNVVVDFQYSARSGPNVVLRQDAHKLYVEEDGRQHGYIYLNQLCHVASDDGYPPCKQ